MSSARDWEKADKQAARPGAHGAASLGDPSWAPAVIVTAVTGLNESPEECSVTLGRWDADPPLTDVFFSVKRPLS